MFLVKESATSRETKIRQLFDLEPGWAVVLSVIHFEWTIRRAIIALGTSPNIEIRAKLKNCHGCDSYKNLWREEVLPNVKLRLPEVVENWDNLRKAFKLRHRLVHGVAACDSTYAKERMIWAMAATANIRDLCTRNKIDLESRLSVRRKRLQR